MWSQSPALIRKTFNVTCQFVSMEEVKDPQKAIEAIEQLKQGGEHQRTLLLTLDASDTDEERDMSLISFYKHKRDNIQWAAPFHCRIQGGTSTITLTTIENQCLTSFNYLCRRCCSW